MSLFIHTFLRKTDKVRDRYKKMKENVRKTNNFYIPHVNFHPSLFHFTLMVPSSNAMMVKVVWCRVKKKYFMYVENWKTVGTISHTFTISFTRYLSLSIKNGKEHIKVNEMLVKNKWKMFVWKIWNFISFFIFNFKFPSSLKVKLWFI